jgi:glycosyltransferase involved in cell wall biosynthesis
MGIRRWIAVKKREHVLDSWPILPGSEKTPKNWSGWPDGKKFAFVLTHDVEGPSGLAKCRELMKLEMELGFRSSFNFIPEGPYSVTKELRDELTQNGFEVGVHDLHHDGKLYASRQDFARKAARINIHLKDWGAVGFRSGFMLRKLDWLHDLDVAYDSSTFDTDPFEPQPDGAGTIFPFWVPRPRKLDVGRSPTSNLELQTSNLNEGYVELPYTLPQDSTLFLLFRERHPDIWFQKLDWVAAKGGMALLNVHPDYMNFDGSPRRGREYPYSRYKEFLKYVAANYREQCWHVTPGDMARWYRANAVNPDKSSLANHVSLRGKKAAVVLYSYYPSDPRPRRAAEALAHSGMEVDLICLRQKESEPTREVINGVNVRRVPMRRRRDSKLTYLFQYGSFILVSTVMLALRSFRKRYHLVHVHNMPDVLVFSALMPKLLGAKVILDLHDPMPELMTTIFGIREQSFVVRLLKWLEKLSTGFAHQVVTVNLACKKIFAARSCKADKIEVVMNAPDEGIFKFRAFESSGTRDRRAPFIIMCHGSIVERHGLDLAVQALRLVKENIPCAQLRIYGASTPFLESVMKSVRETGLQDSVHYLGSKPLESIAQAIAECDVGIIPNRRSIFTELNTPTRIFEYLAMGKAVIAPRAPGITDYFGPDDLVFFELGDAADLARAIQFAFSESDKIKEIVTRGQAVYLKHSWAREKEAFVGRVDELLQKHR